VPKGRSAQQQLSIIANEVAQHRPSKPGTAQPGRAKRVSGWVPDFGTKWTAKAGPVVLVGTYFVLHTARRTLATLPVCGAIGMGQRMGFQYIPVSLLYSHPAANESAVCIEKGPENVQSKICGPPRISLPTISIALLCLDGKRTIHAHTQCISYLHNGNRLQRVGK